MRLMLRWATSIGICDGPESQFLPARQLSINEIAVVKDLLGNIIEAFERAEKLSQRYEKTHRIVSEATTHVEEAGPDSDLDRDPARTTSHRTLTSPHPGLRSWIANMASIVPKRLVNSALARGASRTLKYALPVLAAAKLAQSRPASTQPNYEGHIPLNWLEHGFMLAGASYQALFHPQRGGESCTSAAREPTTLNHS